MERLYKLENDKCLDYAVLQGCFAGMFGKVVQIAPVDDTCLDIKSKLVSYVASWVYLFDMYIDLECDRASGSFNAILQNGGDDESKMIVRNILTEVLSDAEKLCNLLPYSAETEIIQNIISYGLPMQMRTHGVIL
jgi:hypothetical protein